MSRGELWKGVAISLIMAIVFGLIGGAAVWLALQMVGIFGEAMGVDARSREIYAQAHMVVHLFAAACGLAIGWFLHRRNWVLFGIALIAIITCGSYGVLNMYGFASSSRVTVAATKDAARAAAERSYQSARADLVAQIDWLQKTAVKEDGRERRRLLTEVDTKRKELSNLKPPVPTAETVLSDTQSSSLAELTGTSARRWLVALPLPLAIFVFFAESFSLVIVGHMLAGIAALVAAYFASSAKAVADAPTASNGGNTSSGGGSNSNNVVPLRPTEQATPVLQAPAAVADIATAAGPVAPEAVAQPATQQQRSELPVATAPPPLTPDVRAAVARLRAAGKTWRQVGSELGRDHTVLFKQFHGGKAAKRHNGSLGPMNRRRNGGPQPLYA